MAEHIDSIDELKRALSIEDLRNMSSEKVLELVKLIQNGQVGEVPRVLFLGICLDRYYFLWRGLLPKIGFHLNRGSVSQALVEPCLVPP